MNLEGIIKQIGELTTLRNDNTVRRLVLTTDADGKYPQNVPIDFYNDKAIILNKYKVGQKVSVGINIRGREKDGKYYPNIDGWKMAHIIDQQVTSSQQNPGRESYQIDVPY